MSDPILFIQDLAVIFVSASICAYLCTRIGLSPVVGYLTAGLIVGTPEVVVPYVTDEARIEVIAQLGVVFLMFSIGIQFRLQRIRELGLPIVIATLVTAILVLTAGRMAGVLLGLSEAAGVALAAIFMGSSSAIISKIIQERGMGHERHGQLALGITLMEDIVAVIMLAVLGSYLLIGGDSATRPPVETVGLLMGFAILVFIFGMLLIPRVLRSMDWGGKSETTSIFLAAMIMLMALVAVRAGYSLALGAFLCGMIVAETRQKSMIERSFQGLKDLFLTIFFVTIGMMIDLHAVPGALKWILLGTAGALFGRSLASFTSLLLVGEHPRTAFRSALCLTPIGEFSFIIAGVAVAGGLFSETFQVAAVGTALLTSMISPVLASNGERLSRFLADGHLPRIEQLHQSYARFWSNLARAGASRGLWTLLRKRVIQIGLELLAISALLIFAAPIYSTLREFMPALLESKAAYLAYWLLLGVACLIPLVAIWRNFSASALMVAEYSDRRRGGSGQQTAVVDILLKTAFALFLGIWIWNLLPADLPRAYLVGGVFLVALPLILLTWRRMVRWHSQVEWAFTESFEVTNADSGRRLFDSWRDEGWDLNVEELFLPDDSAWSGRTLAETQLRQRTGCSIVGMARHGHNLSTIGPSTHLFPGDELLLLGSQTQIEAAREVLTETILSAATDSGLDNRVLESCKIMPMNPAVGKSLAELNWSRLYGVQVAALLRDGKTYTALEGSTKIEANDTLLLLGPIGQMAKITGDGED